LHNDGLQDLFSGQLWIFPQYLTNAGSCVRTIIVVASIRIDVTARDAFP